MSQTIVQGYHCIANINYPPSKTPVPLDRVFFLLNKVHQSGPSLPFRWQILTKPKGSLDNNEKMANVSL